LKLSLINKNRDVLDWIKFFVFLGAVLAGIIVWYYNDTNMKYVNKEVYDTQQSSITQKLSDIQNHITISKDEVKESVKASKKNITEQVDSLKEDLNSKHNILKSKVDQVATQQAVIKSRQARLIEDVKKINK
tara:strand:+ start:48329 stop:48724 length:396 start_codon:yes stop_codon:yes gene_type:complete